MVDYSKLTALGATAKFAARAGGSGRQFDRYEFVHPNSNYTYVVLIDHNFQDITTPRIVNSNGETWKMNRHRDVPFAEAVSLIENHIKKQSAKTTTTNQILTNQIPTVKYTDAELLSSIEELIETNGQTSTKEVKEHLRLKGLKAVQDDVSHDMAILANQGILDFSFQNGNTWKTYTKPVQTTQAQDPTNQIGLQQSSGDDAIILVSRVTGVHPSAIGGGSRLAEDLGVDAIAYMQIENAFLTLTNKPMPLCKTIADIQNAF